MPISKSLPIVNLSHLKNFLKHIFELGVKSAPVTENGFLRIEFSMGGFNKIILIKNKATLSY